jgi:hypothetical protein
MEITRRDYAVRAKSASAEAIFPQAPAVLRSAGSGSAHHPRAQSWSENRAGFEQQL